MTQGQLWIYDYSRNIENNLQKIELSSGKNLSYSFGNRGIQWTSVWSTYSES